MWRRPALLSHGKNDKRTQRHFCFWTTRGWLLPQMRGFLQEDFKSKLPTWQHIILYFTNKKIYTRIWSKLLSSQLGLSVKACVLMLRQRILIHVHKRVQYSHWWKQKHQYDCLNIYLKTCVNVCIFRYTYTMPASFFITSLSTFNCMTYLEREFLTMFKFKIHLTSK